VLGGLIWRRAVQLAGRAKPTYRVLRDAAKEIVPPEAVKRLWTGELIDRLAVAKRQLTVSVDLAGVPEPTVARIAQLLVDLQRRVSELSVEVGGRIDQIRREEAA
jgi:hypothetical protein